MNKIGRVLVVVGVTIFGAFGVTSRDYAGGAPVMVQGKRFMQDGKEVILNGVNYFPDYFPKILPHSWLDAPHYRPTIVERDLAVIQQLGFNLVSIHGLEPGVTPSERDCANLSDFLQRARLHGLLVDLYVGPWVSVVPISNVNVYASVPRACKLAGNSALFAYDIAWEPHFGSETQRRGLAPRWTRWLEGAYGSIDQASNAFGGGPEMPTDEELCSEARSVKVAAFRRFLDDVLSENYQEIRWAIHGADDTHLIGTRSGFGGNGNKGICGEAPVDLRAGAKYLDFISPEAYALPKTDKAGLLALGGFTAAYADVGKPVYWAEYGAKADNSCPFCTESGQAQYISNMLDLIRETRSNGGAVWWYVGVRPQVPADLEHSDFGIVREQPNGGSVELRPAATLFKGALDGYSASQRSYSRWVTVDRDAAAGAWKMYLVGAQEFAQIPGAPRGVGVHTACFGTTSATVDSCVGDTPYSQACPAKCLDSEWNSVLIKNASGTWQAVSTEGSVRVKAGQPIYARLSVGNIGEGKWLTQASAGDVRGSVNFGCRERVGDISCRKSITGDRAMFGDDDSGEFVISRGIRKKSRVVFQMVSEQVGWFGQQVDVTLIPQ